ncbi:hypothetical protein ACQR3Q_17740 [Dietzia natronolimnaea]|uniref:hypothetical protein n=1 Tax=Dietzia natronolimnaea TaxID=161920 RepID=UPI003D1179B1
MSKALTIKVNGDQLELGPVQVSFQRTLRIPEDGLHALPPGLGRFPLRRVADYPDTAPADWLDRGGVMMPLYQREAMWMSFNNVEPAALQVGVGKVCAISGGPWDETLSQDPQNYAALPDQPWLDGINAGDGYIRQFVAVPLGLGATVEAQVTGSEEHGGVQLRAVGLTDDALRQWQDEQSAADNFIICGDEQSLLPSSAPAMGFGAGGRMRQEVYADDRGVPDYDEKRSGRVFVHLCSASQWATITGEVPPPTPVDRGTYIEHGLPWFDYYDADHQDLARSDTLGKVKTVGTLLGDDDGPHTVVDPATVVQLKGDGGDVVDDGQW